MTYTTLTGLTPAEVGILIATELPAEYHAPASARASLTDAQPLYRCLQHAFGLCGYGWGCTYEAADVELSATEAGNQVVIRRITVWYTLWDPAGQETRCTVPAAGACQAATIDLALWGATLNALGYAAARLGTPSRPIVPTRAATHLDPTPAPAEIAPSDPAVDGDDPGLYVIPIGTQYKGCAVKDLPPAALVWFAEKMSATTALAQAVQSACTSYLAAHPELRPARAETIGLPAK